eukprot:10871750-Lingulodinium_polyedra.AAC.1
MHSGAVDSAVRGRSGPLLARSRVPCERRFSGARVECASVRLASRRGGGRSIRPHRCAAFAKCYTMMRSNRPCVIVA